MSTPTPVRKRRMKRATARALTIGAVIAAVVVVVAMIAGVLYARHAERAAQVLAAAQAQTAGRLAAAVAERLQATRLRLRAIAADPRAVAALTDGDATARAAAAAALGGGLPQLLRLRLVPADVDEIDDSRPAPLTYASLDLFNRARAGERDLQMEVHLFGTQDQHAVLIEPVSGPDGELLGFVHAAFALELLGDALTGLDLDGAYIELRQPVPKGEELSLARRGGAAPPPDITAAAAPVAGTAWSLAYWGIPRAEAIAAAAAGAAEPAGAGAGVGLLLPLVAVVLALGLAAGAAVWWRSRQAALAGEVVVYQGAVRAIMEGAHPGLERLVPGLAAGAGTGAPPARPLPDRLEGDDVTVVQARPRPSAAEVAGATGETDTLFADETHGAGGVSTVPEVIFRTYDIRGVAGESLTAEGVYAIGRAIGTEAYERGQQGLVVARDARPSSEELAEALIRGLRDTGRDVIDLGLAPTPLLYFATHYLDTASGVMVTGSHNPPQYNGLKIVLSGETLCGEAIQAIRKRMLAAEFASGTGSLHNAEIVPEYIRRVSEDIPVALGNALKIVVDCGNAVPGTVAPQLLRALGHDVIELYCEVDGTFPNHHPDPSQPENLRDLIDMVKLENADLGLAFDGDGDRLGVVDGEGNVIWPDRQMILFARDVLSRNPGAPIVFDVKCSRHLAEAIAAAGGKPVMWHTGHSLIKAKMKELGAPLAGEMSGHIFFKERWYGFDDALYAAARLTEILLHAGRPPAAVFAELPGGVATPELRMDLPESEHAAFMDKLREAAKFDDGELITIDGVRVDFPYGWALVRPSNTTPCLVLRFEGEDQAALDRIKKRFRNLIKAVAPQATPPF